MIAHRIFLACALLGALLFNVSATEGNDRLNHQAAAALKKAITFYRTQIARHGGYVYYTSTDLQQRWGEGVATDDQVWVQPPGTPAVGLAYLAAFEATGDRDYLDAARETADALLYGQLQSGGWTNVIDFNPSGDRVALYRNGKGRGRNYSSLDDGTSQAAIHFLTRLDGALQFEDAAIHKAAQVALDSLLAAQFPIGAFPQGWEGPVKPQRVLPASYPNYDWRTEGRIKNYWDYYTLNDDLAGSVVEALTAAWEVYKEEKYSTALKRFGDFLCLAQMPAPQPAWAQQYNYQMQPMWARPFEPAAIAGRESQDVIAALMAIYRVTGESKFLEPIPKALAYLRSSRLPDGSLARYYELQTNRPLYMVREGRQYHLTYDDSDLPSHYGWKWECQGDELAAEFRSLRSERAGKRSESPTTALESRVRQIINDLDTKGRWISIYQGEALVGQPKFAPQTPYVDSAVFVENVKLLSEYLGRHASEATTGAAPQQSTSTEAEPESAGPDSAEPDSAAPDAAGPDAAGTAKPSGAAEPQSPDEWYGAGVRPTEARTPEEEQAGFHLPAGFEVRLVAAEPEIKKPMNLSFDVQGRIWVTDTLEYPYPAPPGEPGRDSVRILEDTNGDGRADSVTTFAEGLNIPIGVLPYGEGCICYSIPNLWYLRDTDGDGKCDRRDLLLGPFDTSRDTHGMINSLRAGDDGWIYACHGFNNRSHVAGSDGYEITLVSGNTFRFLPDGSRVEHVTWGQVNPFGVTVDEWGYVYSADCHSKPISQLIRGGYYPSFGRPHDGLGFVPPMMDHLHGSTAIAGLAYFPAALGTESLENQMLSGNVMTSRINRTELHRNGATVRGEPLPDFLTSDDPWFRPVDIRLGPDDCIYVADFYNRIIGHYEVPLDHPQRDRHRGRIWQIRRSDDAASPRQLDDLTSLADLDRIAEDAAIAEDLAATLGDPNPERRNLALQSVATSQQRAVRDAVAELAADSDASPTARVSALWCLYRWREIEPAVARRLAADPSPQLRTHLQRMLGEWVSAPSGTPSDAELAWIMELTRNGLEDADANVVRAAAEALGRAGAADALDRLLSRLLATEPSDPILRQTIRIAIRDILAISESHQQFLQDWQFTEASRAASSELAQIALAIDSERAGHFLVAHLHRCGEEEPQAETMMRHAASTLAVEELEDLVAVAQTLVDKSHFDETELLEQFTAARRTKDDRIAEPLQQWAREQAQRKLAQAIHSLQAEAPSRIRWRSEAGVAWPSEARRTLDDRPVTLASSFPLGETTTDTLQSETFAAPAEIEFWLAGHNGHPDEPDHRRNRIELIAAASGQVVHVAFPPRRDAVERIRWDCRAIEGQPVRIRCTDGDSGSAYAWLAFGGFAPERLEPSTEAEPLTQALRLVVQYELRNLRKQLVELARGHPIAPQRSAAVAEALARLDGNRRLAALISMADRLPWHELTAPAGFFAGWVEAAIAGDQLDDAAQLEILCRTLSTTDQRQLARRFATHRETASLLIGGIEAGDVAPDVLTDKEVEAGLEAVANDAMQNQIASLRQRARSTDAAVAAAISRLVDQTLQRLAPPPPSEVQAAAPAASLPPEPASLASRPAEPDPIDLELGRAVFTKQCSVCHQLAGQGQVVGPQLEGVGNRGVQRLLEDILQPDLNVDQAFRTTTVLTVDGAVVTGLVRNVTETEIVLTAADGKVTTISNAAIEVQRAGTTSLMPSNFHETLTAQQLAALVAYLQQHARQE